MLSRGEVISDGPQNPHDILRLKGEASINQLHRQRSTRRFTA